MRLSTKMCGLENLLFFEFINIVLIFHNYIDFIMLLYNFLVISFALYSYKQSVWFRLAYFLIYFLLLLARTFGNLSSICLGVSILRFDCLWLEKPVPSLLLIENIPLCRHQELFVYLYKVLLNFNGYPFCFAFFLTF